MRQQKEHIIQRRKDVKENTLRRWFREARVRVIRGKATPKVDDKETVCINCGTTFMGNYCYRCGQSREIKKGLSNNLLKAIGSSILGLNSQVANVLYGLTYRPGYMIAEYIEGRRIKYMEPFKTFLVLAAIYIIIVKLLAMPGTYQISTWQEILTYLANNGFVEISDYLTQLTNSSYLLNNVVSFIVEASQGQAFFFIVEILMIAYFTRIAFHKRHTPHQYNYVEHVFIQAYISCLTLMATIIYLIFCGIIDKNTINASLPVAIDFGIRYICYIQLFKKSWTQTLWCFLLTFIISYLAIFAIITIIIIISFAIYLML